MDQLEQRPTSSFIKTHPIEFALFDQNNHYALYIDDNPLGQPLEFEVHNISERDIEFRLGDGETASESNFHFELQFRKGILSANTLKRLEAAQLTDGVIEGSDSWDLYVSSPGDHIDHISLYLLHTGETTWAANTRRRLRFAGINADAVGGARGTRVVMLPNQLSFVGSDAPITGKRTQHLSIINHQGQKELPLHVAFKGSNQVLNINGAETTLTLQLVNIVRRAQTHTDIAAISLRAPSDDRSASRFILEVDVEEEGEEKAWALAHASELALSITAVVKRRGQTTADSGARFTVIPNTQAISPQWAIMPQQDLSLDAGDTLELMIAGIRSSLPTGPANLYLHYDHIEGYQDGRFTLPVLKSPLLFTGGNVSIGRANPAAKLTIEAGSGLALKVEPNPAQSVYIGRRAQNSLEFNYASGQAINSTANISLNIDSNSTDASHVRYIDFRANGGGFEGGQRLMQIRDGGQVAIGGKAWAMPNHKMAAGSLTIGNIDQNYGGERGWGFNAAGLLLECAANTEVAVHDYMNRVTSLMYYQGDQVNQITIGRDMGWGTTKVRLVDSLTIDQGDRNDRALTLRSSGPGWGSGMGFENSASPGGYFGIYAGADGNWHFADMNRNVDLLVMDRQYGTVTVKGNLAVEGALSKKFTRWWTLDNPSRDYDWGNTRIGATATAQWTNSDARLKTDIQAIDSPLDKLAQLRGVTYSWSDEGLRYLTAEIDSIIFAGPAATEEENEKARDDARQEAYALLARREVGLLAQDVEEVMPQLVRQEEDGYKEIRYDLLVTLLVEAVKEQQEMLQALKKRLN